MKKTKIIAYYAAHYGAQWAREAVASIAPFVDEIYVFYTSLPTFGHSTSYQCPETFKDIFPEVQEGAMGTTLIWHDITGKFTQEGQHRDHAVAWVTEQGADLVLAPDLDEIYDPDCLAQDIEAAIAGRHKIWRMRVQGHFWRSVNWICTDPLAPVRIIKPSGEGDATGFLPSAGFWHFGYAQSNTLILYKMRIHGHKNEIRPGWYVTKFRDWQPGVNDVHPTNVDFWDPQEFDREEIGYLIGSHPYFSDQMI